MCVLFVMYGSEASSLNDEHSLCTCVLCCRE